MSSGGSIDDYCKPTAADVRKPMACPTCGSLAKIGPKFTVSVMARDAEIYLHPEHLPAGRYFICKLKSCPPVYFAEEGSLRLRKDEVRVRVWQKDHDPDVSVCYVSTTLFRR